MGKIGEIRDKKSKPGSRPLDKYLPGLDEKEELLKSRTNALDELQAAMKEERPFGKKLLNAAFPITDKRVTGALNLARERTEAPVANVLDELQRGGSSGDILTAVKQGATGERPGEVGDPVRSVLPDEMADADIGVPLSMFGLGGQAPEINIGGVDVREGLASITGLGASIGLDMAIINGVKSILTGTRGVVKNIGKALEVGNKTKSAIGDKIGSLFTKAGKKVRIPHGRMTAILKELDDDIINRITKTKRYGIQLEQGAIDNTAENGWRIKMALDDQLTAKDFTGNQTKQLKKVIKHAADQFRSVIRDVVPESGPLLDKYSKYSDALGEATDILTNKHGKIKTNRGVKSLSITGEPADRIALENFGKTFKEAGDVIKQLRRLLHKRRLIGAASGIALREFFKNRNPSTTNIYEAPNG